MTKPDQSEGDRARDQVLAGEYVLGVLSAEARARVEARLRHDRAFAAMVARWEENLLPAEEDYMFTEPPGLVLPLLETRRFDQRRHAFSRGGAPALWNSVGLWKGLACTTLFLLAGTVFFVERQGIPDLSAKPLTVQMQPQDTHSLSLVARYEAQSGLLQVTPAHVGPSPQHSLELWLMRGNDPAVSLGVLPQTGEGAIVVPKELRGQLGEGATLAVSLEPFGGSPAGKATGPVLALGQTHMP